MHVVLSFMDSSKKDRILMYDITEEQLKGLEDCIEQRGVLNLNAEEKSQRIDFSRMERIELGFIFHCGECKFHTETSTGCSCKIANHDIHCRSKIKMPERKCDYFMHLDDSYNMRELN